MDFLGRMDIHSKTEAREAAQGHSWVEMLNGWTSASDEQSAFGRCCKLKIQTGYAKKYVCQIKRQVYLAIQQSKTSVQSKSTKK
jgi:hypothetical protein